MFFLKVKHYFFCWVFIVGLLAVPVAGRAGSVSSQRFWAVLIGVEKYPYISKVKRLEFAENNVKAVRKFLTGRLEFPDNQVFTFTGRQADRTNIVRFLHAELPEKIPPGSELFVYFAGRTRMDKGACYLLLSDFQNISFYKGAIPVSLLLRMAGAVKPSKFFFALDAPCKEKMLQLEAGFSTDFRSSSAGPGKWALLAGIDHGAPDKGVGGLSVFCHYLLKGLEGEADSNQDGRVMVPELNDFIAPELWKKQKQLLQFGKLPGSSNRMFAFVLSGRESDSVRFAEKTLLSSRSPILSPVRSEFRFGIKDPKSIVTRKFLKTQVKIKDSAYLEMIQLPAGEFMMGGDKEFVDQLPAHRVVLDSFWIGAKEVTQKQWQAVMGYNTADVRGPKLPIVRVDWFDAQLFTERLNGLTDGGFRLPTEAEWEYACRAGISLKYHFDSGDMMLPDYAWYLNNSDKTIHPAGRKKPNSWGLYDMYGNVWEWCQDYYDKDYYKESPLKNPLNRTKSIFKVARGGFYGSVAHRISSSMRIRLEAGVKTPSLGFRVARDAL